MTTLPDAYNTVIPTAFTLGVPVKRVDKSKDKTAHAVVIGGGIMAASAAHFLAKKGLGQVLLLENRN